MVPAYLGCNYLSLTLESVAISGTLQEIGIPLACDERVRASPFLMGELKKNTGILAD